MIKAPQQLVNAPFHSRSLGVEGCTIVESCTHQAHSDGSMLVSEHLLVFVLEGKYTARTGDLRLEGERNEAIIVRKAHVVGYQKNGYLQNEKPYEAIMFFIKDDFLKDFIRLSQFKADKASRPEPLFKIRVDEKLLGFIESIKPYFAESQEPALGLLKIKMMELLYNLSLSNAALFPALLEFSSPVQTDLVRVMEENFTKPLSLNDLAYRAGRSLAGFKRDFVKTYRTAPAKWIAHKRLEYAKKLIVETDMSVGKACVEAGFESLSHFSRLFKHHYGVRPSSLKH